MKKIQSKRFKELHADLIDHPPVNHEEDVAPLKEKRKKKIYQLNTWVDDIDIEDVVE